MSKKANKMAGAPTQLNDMGLTPKRRKFVEAFTDKKNPKTFLNQTNSAKVAYGYTNDNVAGVEGNRVLKDAKANASIREILGQTVGLRDKISKTLEKIIDEGTSDKGQRRHALQAIDLICKITGEYAPEKHEIGPMSKEDRKSRLEEIAQSIKGVRKLSTGEDNIGDSESVDKPQKLDTDSGECITIEGKEDQESYNK